MEKELRKIWSGMLGLVLISMAGFTLFSFWLKHQTEDKAKDMIVLRLLDTADMLKSEKLLSTDAAAADGSLFKTIQSFRIGRFGFIVLIQDATIIAAPESSFNGKKLRDLGLPEGFIPGDFFSVDFYGEKYMVCYEQLGKMHIVGLYPYSEIYEDFHITLLFLAVIISLCLLPCIFLSQRIQQQYAQKKKQ